MKVFVPIVTSAVGGHREGSSCMKTASLLSVIESNGLRVNMPITKFGKKKKKTEKKARVTYLEISLSLVSDDRNLPVRNVG